MILNHTGTFLVKLWWFIIGAFFIGYSSSLIIRQNILNQFQKMKIWNGGQLRKCFCIIDKVKRLSCATLRKFFLSGKISWIYHNSQWIGIYDYYYLYIFIYKYLLLLLSYWKLSLCCFLMEKRYIHGKDVPNCLIWYVALEILSWKRAQCHFSKRCSLGRWEDARLMMNMITPFILKGVDPKQKKQNKTKIDKWQWQHIVHHSTKLSATGCFFLVQPWFGTGPTQ